MLSNADSVTNWPETTILFALDTGALEELFTYDEDGTTVLATTLEGDLFLGSFTTSADSTVSVVLTTEGYVAMVWKGDYYGETALTSIESTLCLVTRYVYTNVYKVVTYFYGVNSSGKIYSYYQTGNIGTKLTDAYVSEVSVNPTYVTGYSVTNAALNGTSTGVTAAALALNSAIAEAAAAAVPEPTTATLSLLALAGLAARRRRK